MTAPLRACPGCSRHVRVGEPVCPFCGGELGGAFRSAPSPRAPSGRLSRAALFAVGAAGFVAGSVSCSSSSYGGPPPDLCPDSGCTPYVPEEASVEAPDDGPDIVDATFDGSSITDAAGIEGAAVDGSGDTSVDAPIDSAVSAPVEAGTFLIFYGAPPH